LSFERQVNNILRKKCDQLNEELKQTQAAAAMDRRKYQQLKAALANAIVPDDSEVDAETGRDPNHMFSHAGCGYSDTELTRTIYNHITSVMGHIQSLVGDDALKALQLSDRVKQRARGGLTAAQDPDGSNLEPKYVRMCVGVFESLQGFLKDLQAQYTTKAPSKVKAIMQTIVTAIMADYDATSQRYLAQHLELSTDWLVDGEARAATLYD
jgi:hypothetical protein